MSPFRGHSEHDNAALQADCDDTGAVVCVGFRQYLADPRFNSSASADACVTGVSCAANKAGSGLYDPPL